MRDVAEIVALAYLAARVLDVVWFWLGGGDGDEA